MTQKNIPICELNQLLKRSIFLPNLDILSEFFYKFHKKQRDRLSLVEILRRNYIQIPNLKYGISIKTGSLRSSPICIPANNVEYDPANFEVLITSGIVICRVIADFSSKRSGFIQNIETGNTIIPSFRFCWYPDDISKNTFKFTTVKSGIELADQDDDSYFALTTGLRIHGIVDDSLLDNFS
mgnify:CR=1 FL=1